MSGGTAKAHSIVARRAVASTEKAAAEPVLARTDRKTRSSSARRLGGGSDRPADVSDDQLSYLEPDLPGAHGIVQVASARNGTCRSSPRECGSRN